MILLVTSAVHWFSLVDMRAARVVADYYVMHGLVVQYTGTIPDRLIDTSAVDLPVLFELVDRFIGIIYAGWCNVPVIY